jgi:hypothetical protein
MEVAMEVAMAPAPTTEMQWNCTPWPATLFGDKTRKTNGKPDGPLVSRALRNYGSHSPSTTCFVSLFPILVISISTCSPLALSLIRFIKASKF